MLFAVLVVLLFHWFYPVRRERPHRVWHANFSDKTPAHHPGCLTPAMIFAVSLSCAPLSGRIEEAFMMPASE